VVEHQPSKLDMWVRFPSPALFFCPKGCRAKESTVAFLFIFPLLYLCSFVVKLKKSVAILRNEERRN
jgi:hypothetical protein